MPGSQTPEDAGELRHVQFVNKAKENKEWSAHLKLLNGFTTPDRYLRDILQYARSGPFYPTDMHVGLIKDLIAAEQTKLLDRLQATSYLEEQSKDQNALRAQVVRVAMINNERRRLKRDES